MLAEGESKLGPRLPRAQGSQCVQNDGCRHPLGPHLHPPLVAFHTLLFTGGTWSAHVISTDSVVPSRSIETTSKFNYDMSCDDWTMGQLGQSDWAYGPWSQD